MEKTRQTSYTCNTDAFPKVHGGGENMKTMKYLTPKYSIGTVIKNDDLNGEIKGYSVTDKIQYIVQYENGKIGMLEESETRCLE